MSNSNLNPSLSCAKKFSFLRSLFIGFAFPTILNSNFSGCMFNKSAKLEFVLSTTVVVIIAGAVEE